MKTKHTPGSWKIEKNDHRLCIRGTENFYSIFSTKSQNGDTISETVAENVEKQDAELIAVAPELLDLLEAAVARIELANDEGDPILSAWLTDAKSAIAKAKGVEHE